MDDIEKFEIAWDHYWFTIKPLYQRLTDSIEYEEKICAKFFQALKEKGFIK